MLGRILLPLVLTLLGATPAFAQSSNSDATVRVVDIGAGLCVIISVPGDHAMLYDAGPPGAARCRDAARELVPGRKFDLVVLSHSDNDHISMLPALLDKRANGAASEFFAGVIIHPGDPRGPALDPVRRAITYQGRRGATVFNLFEADHPSPGSPTSAVIRPGDSFAIGAARATFVAGWSNGNMSRGPGEDELEGGPLNNAISIVIRFDYGGHSVLLTGDTVGRMIGDPANTCAYAERFMVANQQRTPIDSDVLIGQHHGADNASSTCFASAVTPQYVIFSAGHKYHHPTERAADRLISGGGVAATNILRTDRGDNEGASEMTAGSGRCPDVRGDDDVEVLLPQSTTAPISVSYRSPSARCVRQPPRRRR